LGRFISATRLPKSENVLLGMCANLWVSALLPYTFSNISLRGDPGHMRLKQLDLLSLLVARREPTVGIRQEIDALAEGAVAEPEPQLVAIPGAGLELEQRLEQMSITVRLNPIARGPHVQEGSYLVVEDDLRQMVGGEPALVEVKQGRSDRGLFPKDADRIRRLVEIRDVLRELLRAQEADEPWQEAQASLRTLYDAFVAVHGPINKTEIRTREVPRKRRKKAGREEAADPEEIADEEDGAEESEEEPCGDNEDFVVRVTYKHPNLRPFYADPDCWLVASIEDYDPDSDLGRPGPVFTERVVAPPPVVTITTPKEALAFVLNERGRVDMQRICELLNQPRDQVTYALSGAVFHDPVTKEWQTADAYLSGDVVEKLAQAQAAEREMNWYRRNVQALMEVQPVDLGPSEITARLGAPWIPTEVIEAFIRERIGVNTKVRHVPEAALWSVDQAPFKTHPGSQTQWGTGRRHAGSLLEDALNATTPQLFNTDWVPGGGSQQKLNAQATEAAKEKLDRIKDAFERWVWLDQRRADVLSRKYNTTYNTLRSRTFDGSHLMLPGTSVWLSFRPHQKSAIWRVVATGDTYLAHVVGSGKTLVCIAALMEQKRLGLIKKPIVVVPGHTLAQWAREFYRLYPNARLLVATEHTFSKAHRPEFLNRAASGDWDAILITHHSFKLIPAPAQFEIDMLRERLNGLASVLNKISTNDTVNRKRLQKTMIALRIQIERLQKRTLDGRDFSELGVDMIVVDEAQVHRKLSFQTTMASLKGIDPDGSQIAWDLYVKSRSLASQRPGRSLVLASGTPITNTMGEMYSLLRFMSPELLDERLVQEFDSWALAFGATKTDLEAQASGQYKQVTRFAEFVNLPELTSMFRVRGDVVVNDDIRHLVRLPRIKGGQRQVISVPAGQGFRKYQSLVLGPRIQAIEGRRRPPEKGEDILLTVITDGRHAGIDTRMVDPIDGLKKIGRASVNPDDWKALAEDDPGNKLNQMIDRVFEIWSENRGRQYENPMTGEPYPLTGAAQMIFSDLGTLSVEETRGFSAYRWIKRRLVDLGIPSEQIEFMQDHKTAESKQRLFNAVNGGQVLVLIGSSETMGTGVNVQQRLIALHHLDVPWLPSQIEQREGRIIRQGNQNEEIEIYAWATRGSLDVQMWQALERKARFIAAALKGDVSVRKIQDEDGSIAQSDQFAIAKAIASGDERLMQLAGLRADIGRLERLQEAHAEDRRSARKHVERAQKDIAECSRKLPKLEEDVQRARSSSDQEFFMKVGEQTYTRDQRKEAAAKLIEICRGKKEEGHWDVGEFSGFQLYVTCVPSKSEGGKPATEVGIARVSGDVSFRVDEKTAPGDLIRRLEIHVGRIPGELEELRAVEASARQRLETFVPAIELVFSYEEDLRLMRRELVEVKESLVSSPQAAA
jgi:N12 class adenine-specific DNA methylase